MSIVLDQVTKRYQGSPVVNDVSLDVGRGRIPGAAGAERQRQEHAPARHRRPHRGRPRHDLAPRARRHARVGARAPGRFRVPALRALPAHERGGQHRVRAAGPPREGFRASGASQGTAEARRARGHGRPAADPALGRPAAAHRRGARAGAPAEGAADGRALRRAGRQDPRGTPPHYPRSSARTAHDHHSRHSRPGGGLRARRPHRRHEPGAPARVRPPRRPVHASGRRASWPLSSVRPTCCSAIRRRRACGSLCRRPRPPVPARRSSRRGKWWRYSGRRKWNSRRARSASRRATSGTGTSRTCSSAARSRSFACACRCTGRSPPRPGATPGRTSSARCSRSRALSRSSASSRWRRASGSPSVRDAFTCCRRRSRASPSSRRMKRPPSACGNRPCSRRSRAACTPASRSSSCRGRGARPTSGANCAVPRPGCR